MFTSPLPVNLDRYQIRYMGTRPITARADRALEGFVQSGALNAVDLGQAERNGIPSWNVNLIVRERASGAAAAIAVRVDAMTEPNTDLTLGQYVTFDRLEVAWPAVGRHEPRFTYLGIRGTDPGHTEVSQLPLNGWHVHGDDLTIEVMAVRPKLDESTLKPAVRDAARAQGVDIYEHLPQKANAAGVPQWLLDVAIITTDGLHLDKLTVAAPTPPEVSGFATVEGLVIRGGTTEYPNSKNWVALSAERVHPVQSAQAERNGRRGRQTEASAEQTHEQVEV